MVKGYCPDCDTLQPITCTGKRQAPDTLFTSQWWTVNVHKHPTESRVCDGSGKRV